MQCVYEIRLVAGFIFTTNVVDVFSHIPISRMNLGLRQPGSVCLTQYSRVGRPIGEETPPNRLP